MQLLSQIDDLLPALWWVVPAYMFGLLAMMLISDYRKRRRHRRTAAGGFQVLPPASKEDSEDQ